MKKLRLLISEQCNRNCAGCCNKQWDLKNLPVENEFSQYDEIILTGGEPMLNILNIYRVVDRIREESNATIYLYTAMPNYSLLNILGIVDGITITLHEKSDIPIFEKFNFHLYTSFLVDSRFDDKSLRLNIFKEVDYKPNKYISAFWEIKNDIEWISNCPLPNNEVFKRLN
jgi:organic radical activating enzyme